MILAKRFLIQELIYRRASGEFYRAVDQQTGETVAVKRIPLEDGDRERERLFKREASLLRRLNHPRIVKLQHTFVTSRAQYLVTDYVGQRTLADLLAHGRLAMSDVFKIGLLLADTLAAVHREWVIYADLQPVNVLVNKAGIPYLAHFEAALQNQSGGPMPADTVLESYAYQSPEACNRQPLDTRTDIWSFGVMLFEMIAGQRPFAAPKVSQLILSVMADPPPDLQQLRPEATDLLVDLVYRMLAKDPDRRIPSVELVRGELAQAARATGRLTPSLAQPSPVELPDEAVAPQHNLPDSLSLFVGRQQELKEIGRLLHDPGYRLLTLHGPGGIGKTRLAVEAAHRFLSETGIDVFLVDLTTLERADNLVSTIAETLSFQFIGASSPQTQLLHYLENKELLLILDNFEHITEKLNFLSELLLRTTDVQLVVTSQRKLQIREEWVMTVSGLPVSIPQTGVLDSEGPAVQLFLEVSQRIRPDYAPDPEAWQAIRDICTLVEGMPLAIELAASWIDRMPAADIRHNLRQSADLLAADRPDLPNRHRSVHAAFSYAWQLLGDEEKQALRRLSQFRGGFFLDAASRGVGVALATLYALIDKSLLTRSPVNGRFDLQNLLRQFAATALTVRRLEADMTAARHAEYYLDFLHERQRDLLGGRQLEALQEIEQEMSNIRVAWRWASAQGALRLLNLALDALFAFYQLRGRHREGERHFAQTAVQVRALGDAAVPVLSRLLARQGACARFVGHLEPTQELLWECLQVARANHDRREIAFILYNLGAAQPDAPEAKGYWEESLALAEALADQVLIAEALNWLAFAHYRESNFTAAVAALERSLAVRRELADYHGLAKGLTNLGVVHIQMDAFERAQSLLEEGRQIYQRIGDKHGVAVANNNLSHAALKVQDFATAQKRGERSLAQFRQLGNRPAEADALGNLADIAMQQEQYDLARSLCVQCIILSDELGLPANSFHNDLGRIALVRHDYEAALIAFQRALQGQPHEALTLNILSGIAEVWVRNRTQRPAAALLHFLQEQAVAGDGVKVRAATLLMQVRAMGDPEESDPEKIRRTLAEWVALASLPAQ